MKCKSCQKFQSLRKCNNSLNGSYWKCGDKEITTDSNACKDFILYHIITCPKKNKFRRIHIEVCLYYQLEKNCKCKIGLEIKSYIRKQPGKLIRRK